MYATSDGAEYMPERGAELKESAGECPAVATRGSHRWNL